MKKKLLLWLNKLLSAEQVAELNSPYYLAVLFAAAAFCILSGWASDSWFVSNIGWGFLVWLVSCITAARIAKLHLPKDRSG